MSDTDSAALLGAGGALAAGGTAATRGFFKKRQAARADATDTVLAEVVEAQRKHEAHYHAYPSKLRMTRLEQDAAKALKAKRLPVPADVRARLEGLWNG